MCTWWWFSLQKRWEQCEKEFLLCPTASKQESGEEIWFTCTRSLFDENYMLVWIVDSSVNNHAYSSLSLISSTFELIGSTIHHTNGQCRCCFR